MVSVATVVRKTPVELLKVYFAASDTPLDIEWGTIEGAWARPILSAIEKLEPDHHARVTRDAGRIGAMADEAGSAAIYSVATVEQVKRLDELVSGHARAMWLYLNAQRSFDRAEEVRYTDDHRRGRSWDGFVGAPDTEVRRDSDGIREFERAIADRFGSKNVHVEVFDRHRGTFEGDDARLIQATVYSEARSEEYLRFVEGELRTESRHPVIEACITYEPDTGIIEVVARDRAAREDYARVFAASLLKVGFAEERVPLRRYDLSVLLAAHSFPTDPGDGIEEVRLNFLKLMPFDTSGERVTLESLRGCKRTIWQLAGHHFGSNAPLGHGWVVTQARITIRFQPEKGKVRGKVLPLTISFPNGCDLKDRTDRERLIGEKYLYRWHLVAAI